MILPILTYPNSILKKKAETVKDPLDSEIKRLVLDMLETLEKNSGIGLAAPQVGQSLRLCVIKIKNETHILINPKFRYKSWRKKIEEEGCFSLPGEYKPVKRHLKVTVEALNRKGEKITLKAEGLLSRALQHEIDHLDGILIIDKK